MSTISTGTTTPDRAAYAAYRTDRAQDLVVKRAPEHIAERTTAGQSPPKPVAELGDREGRVGGEPLERTFDTGPQAMPGLGLGVAGANEERVGRRPRSRPGRRSRRARSKPVRKWKSESWRKGWVTSSLRVCSSASRDHRHGLAQLGQQRRTSVGETIGAHALRLAGCGLEHRPAHARREGGGGPCHPMRKITRRVRRSGGIVPGSLPVPWASSTGRGPMAARCVSPGGQRCHLLPPDGQVCRAAATSSPDRASSPVRREPAPPPLQRASRPCVPASTGTPAGMELRPARDDPAGTGAAACT